MILSSKAVQYLRVKFNQFNFQQNFLNIKNHPIQRRIQEIAQHDNNNVQTYLLNIPG